MLQLKEGQKVSVFQPKESEVIKNTVEATISSSRKKSDHDYAYFSWNAKFVGKAYEMALELKDKDRIAIKEAAIENYYNKEQKKLYVSVVVFDFEMVQKDA